MLPEIQRSAVEREGVCEATLFSFAIEAGGCLAWERNEKICKKNRQKTVWGVLRLMSCVLERCRSVELKERERKKKRVPGTAPKLWGIVVRPSTGPQLEKFSTDRRAPSCIIHNTCQLRTPWHCISCRAACSVSLRNYARSFSTMASPKSDGNWEEK